MNGVTTGDGAKDRRPAPPRNPFDLEDTNTYAVWREEKLARYPACIDELRVEVRDLERPASNEIAALLQRLRRANMALYHCPLTEHRAALLQFAAQFGLRDPDRNPAAGDDGLSAIRVESAARGGEFIPYTDRAIRWHTDGYYNPPERRIGAFLLHCVRPATAGGENALLDPELLYLRLRDASPEAIAALTHPRALTVPAHVDADGNVLRAEQSGPVFSVDTGGALRMRYTARTRSVRWRDDAATRAAVARLEALLDEPHPGLFRHRLQAGEGLLCNNVLHSRSAFRDDPGEGRLLYRARFRQRIAGT